MSYFMLSSSANPSCDFACANVGQFPDIHNAGPRCLQADKNSHPIILRLIQNSPLRIEISKYHNSY